MTPTIHLLMLIGSVGAMALGLWGEAAVLIFVYSLGDVLESYAVDKARGAIRSLMALDAEGGAGPHETAARSVCAVETIGVGEIVIVRPGERIPVDGTVVAGSSYVDQAAVTGEPVPVQRGPGEEVFAGTINQNGSLEVRVTKPASETMLSRIILSVEEAQAKRTSYQRFSDSFGEVVHAGHVRPRRARGHRAAALLRRRLVPVHLPRARRLRGLVLVRPRPLGARGRRRSHGERREARHGLQGRRLPRGRRHGEGRSRSTRPGP